MDFIYKSFALLYSVLLFGAQLVSGVGTRSVARDQSIRFGRRLQECIPRTNEGCEQFYKDDIPSPLKPGHTCKDFDKLERGNEDHVKQLLIEDGIHPERNTVEIARMAHKHLYYINGSKPGQEFFLCAVPKTGITRSKMVLERLLDTHGRVHKNNKYQYAEDFTKEQRERILFNPDIPRVKFVRNPYIRAISGYLDKIVSHNTLKNGRYTNWHMKWDEIPTFDVWVAKIYEDYKLKKKIDKHFSPQYDQCWDSIGFKFDYILKVENMNNWFPCYVEKFNMWQYVMHGWPEYDDCYMSTTDVPCNGPIQTEHGKLINKNKTVQGAHSHDSLSKLKKYYKNETTAKLVTEVFLHDIVQYDYPFWSEMIKE
eukprot:TRINITY_DN830_c0_g1_i4.p1 TRINITY_DN830_c0_g1~~TRINITY_DN830_c0_g1_i4.p1  ORF type:complete len:381 (-),score=34.41 TRINITY_DN830_c0_g1_i4:441-1544(-)